MESLRTVLRRGFVAGLVTFVAGLALTALLYRDAQRVSAKSAATRFEYRTERIREDLEHRFHNYEVALRSLAGLISARDDFDRRQWRSYSTRWNWPSPTKAAS